MISQKFSYAVFHMCSEVQISKNNMQQNQTENLPIWIFYVKLQYILDYKSIQV